MYHLVEEVHLLLKTCQKIFTVCKNIKSKNKVKFTKIFKILATILVLKKELITFLSSSFRLIAGSTPTISNPFSLRRFNKVESFEPISRILVLRSKLSTMKFLKLFK